MKQGLLVNAYGITEMLSKNDKMPADSLWAFYKLRKFLQPHMEFQNERVEALKEKYKEFANEEGMITGEHLDAYVKEMNDVLNLDIDIGDYNKQKVILKDGIGITIQMMEELEDFIDFEKE